MKNPYMVLVDRVLLGLPEGKNRFLLLQEDSLDEDFWDAVVWSGPLLEAPEGVLKGWKIANGGKPQVPSLPRHAKGDPSHLHHKMKRQEEELLKRL